MDEREKIIDTIRKCFALGDKDRNPSEAEAETALNRAKTLMARYNLSMAEVAERKGASETKIVHETLNPTKVAMEWNWERDLSRVCNALFSTYTFVKGSKRKVVYVGHEQDVALSIEVHHLLRAEVMLLGLRWSREQGNNVIGMSARLKYQEGVVHTLIRRANAQVEGLTKDEASQSTAIVVRKQDDAKAWAEKQFSLVPGRSSYRSGNHGDAYSSGIKDGNKVSLNFKDKMGGGESVRIGPKQ